MTGESEIPKYCTCVVYYAIAPSLVQIAAAVEPVDIQEPFLRSCPQFEFTLFIFA